VKSVRPSDLYLLKGYGVMVAALAGLWLFYFASVEGKSNLGNVENALDQKKAKHTSTHLYPHSRPQLTNAHMFHLGGGYGNGDGCPFN
jgi:hypothetical protein